MTATASPEPTAVADDLAPMKWLIVIQGVAGIILGLLLLTAPGISSLVLVQFLAIYWLVSGIIGLVSLIWDRTQWGWKVFGGVLGVVAGTAVLRHPCTRLSWSAPRSSSSWASWPSCSGS